MFEDFLTYQKEEFPRKFTRRTAGKKKRGMVAAKETLGFSFSVLIKLRKLGYF
jgi:hypothetical protein